MAFQPVPDTASVELFWQAVAGSEITGCEARCGLYVRDEVTGWPAASLQDLAEYTEEWWTTGKNAGTSLRSRFTVDWQLEKVVAKDLTVSNGPTYTVVGTNAGTLTGQTVPPSCPMWVKFLGTPGDEPKDGGIFLPVGSEAELDGTFFASAFVTSVQQAVTDWRVDLNDPTAGGQADWAHVIVSRNKSLNDDVKDARAALRAAIAATRRATAVTNTVGSVAARPIIGSQRDRRAD